MAPRVALRPLHSFPAWNQPTKNRTRMSLPNSKLSEREHRQAIDVTAADSTSVILRTRRRISVPAGWCRVIGGSGMCGEISQRPGNQDRARHYWPWTVDTTDLPLSAKCIGDGLTNERRRKQTGIAGLQQDDSAPERV